jgi:CheY-like chemotaxis protein
MPGMDGYEFLRQLRALPGRRDVPLLALTGFGRAEDTKRTQHEGFFTHLTKPVDVGSLVEILRQVPARKRMTGTALPAN